MKMNKHAASRMIVFLFITIAFASLASAENMTYIYRAPNGEILAQNHTGTASQVNVTLPNMSWNIDLINRDGWLNISIASVNHTAFPVLDIRARNITLSDETYNGSFGMNSNYRYYSKYGYAFNITQLDASKSYTVSFDYISIGGMSYPNIFKCDYDFAANLSDTTNCTLLSTSTNNGKAYAGASGFSSFFLTEDTCVNRCGGPCPACPPSGTGGGGGGGGGGARGPTIVFVKPKPEGATVQVYQGDELVVVYKGAEYHYRINKVGSFEVSLKSLADYSTTDISLGTSKDMTLSGDVVKLSMHVSNNWAMLTFTSVEKSAFSFNLLPPKPKAAATPTGGQATAPAQIQVVTPATTQGAETPVQIPAPAEEIPIPESPIGLWTIIFAVVFVIILVGGIALYRSRLLRLDKPPTVTRTGLEETGLPETSSNFSEPVLISKPAQVAQVAKPVEEPKRNYHMSHEKELELEKYVFHAYSLGFTEEQVCQALLDKGWPRQLVDKVFDDIRQRK